MLPPSPACPAAPVLAARPWLCSWPWFGHLPWPSFLCPLPEEAGELLLAGSGSGLGPSGQAAPAKGGSANPPPALISPAREEGTVLGGQDWLSLLPRAGGQGVPGGFLAGMALGHPGIESRAGQSHPTASFPQLNLWGNGALPVLGVTSCSSPLDGAGLRWGKVPGMAPEPSPEHCQERGDDLSP